MSGFRQDARIAGGEASHSVVNHFSNLEHFGIRLSGVAQDRAGQCDRKQNGFLAGQGVRAFVKIVAARRLGSEDPGAPGRDIEVALDQALSEQIGLSRGEAFRSLRRCKIPSVISTARPR